MANEKRKRRTKEQIIEALELQLDLRTERGKKALEKFQYYASINSPYLGLIDDLLSISAGRAFIEFLDSADIRDYITGANIPPGTRCICGSLLREELMVMGSKGSGRKQGVEGQIYWKIRNKTPMSALGKTTNTPFPLGSKHYAQWEDLLSDLGLMKGHKTKKKALRVLPKLLKRESERMSPNLSARLKDKGLDPNQIIALRNSLIDAADLSDEALLYSLDAGKKNSYGNWFKENIKDGTIIDPEIIRISKKAEVAPQLLTSEERAARTVYYYEHRLFGSNAVIYGLKKDLEHLANLPEEDPFIEKFGRPNLNRHFVRPGTEFRKRKDVKNCTVAELMNLSHLTFIEGIGLKGEVKQAYHDMDELRMQANRDTSHKYGLGRTWDYLLKELKPVFLKMKGELHKEYEKEGKIYKEHVFTQNEYSLLKTFYKRSGIGKGSKRENYLRRFSIGSFREVAPKIITMGRKMKFAKEMMEQKKGDEWLEQNPIKQDYMLKEEFLEKSLKLGIKDPEKLIEVLSDDKILGIKNKNLKKFQESHGKMMKNMYENGLIAKKYISDLKKENALSRYSKLLEKEGVVEIDEELSRKMKKIDDHIKSGLIYLNGQNPLENASRKFISKDGKWSANRLYHHLEGLIRTAGIDISKAEEIRGKISELRKFGESYYITGGQKGFGFFSTEAIDPEYKNRYGLFSAHYMPAISRNLKDLKSAVEVGLNFTEKLKEITEASKMLGIKGCHVGGCLNKENLKGKRIFVERGFKEKVENLYNDPRYGEIRNKARIGYFDK
ncbi:MAG: hypothetical protein KKE23_01580 [Nanoarchaeota archaeon]|nr:hypothetical protein [Nanoarchaeota archaeon]